MRRISSIKKDNDVSKLKYKFFVFDVETTKLEPMAQNFVFGCVYGFNYKKTLYTVEDFIEEFKRPFYKDKYVFAHNAEFDLLTIFGNIFINVDNSAIFNGRFISAKYSGITFCDSMNIYPTSVEKIGTLMGLNKIENIKVKSARLTKSNMTEKDIEYCMRDCEIVYKALLKIFELTGAVKITLPSLSMHEFRHDYIDEKIEFSELVDEFYESYYGGRTEAFIIGKTNAKVYDVNSMYPFAMVNMTLPDIKNLKKVSHCDINFLMFCLERYEGMAKVTVDHAKTFYGYLPSRKILNGAQKLVFPVGEFTTTVNFNELRYAIDQGVVKIKKVHYLIYGNPIKKLFNDFIMDNYNKRKESTDELERTIYKLKMNSLYGRFGMRLKTTTRYYESIPFNYISSLIRDESYYDVKLFSATRADCYLVTNSEQAKHSFFSIPTIASYVTSEARVMLLKALVANEHNGPAYCDTDSIFLTGDFIGDISDNLGSFKLEDKKVIEINGLKNYKYIDKDGKENIVLKGISRGSTKKKTNRWNQDVYETPSFYKTKASLRQSKEAGRSYKRIKVITNNYDKREYFDDGSTRPLICVNDEFINAMTFIKQKSEKEREIFKHHPNNIREAVMVFFINGGQVYTKHLIDYITGTSKAELKSFKGLHAMDGVHMDVFCEYVDEAYYTDRIVDVFQDVLLDFNTADKMKEYLVNLYKVNENEQPKFLEYEFEEDVPF